VRGGVDQRSQWVTTTNNLVSPEYIKTLAKGSKLDPVIGSLIRGQAGEEARNLLGLEALSAEIGGFDWDGVLSTAKKTFEDDGFDEGLFFKDEIEDAFEMAGKELDEGEIEEAVQIFQTPELDGPEYLQGIDTEKYGLPEKTHPFWMDEPVANEQSIKDFGEEDAMDQFLLQWEQYEQLNTDFAEEFVDGFNKLSGYPEGLMANQPIVDQPIFANKVVEARKEVHKMFSGDFLDPDDLAVHVDDYMEVISEYLNDPDIYNEFLNSKMTKDLGPLSIALEGNLGESMPYQLLDNISQILETIGLIAPQKGGQIKNPLTGLLDLPFVKAVETAPLATRTNDFTILVYDLHNNPIIRVPLGGDGFTGVTGKMDSFTGMDLVETLQTAAKEQLGANVDIVGAVPTTVSATLWGGDKRNVFVARMGRAQENFFTSKGPVQPTRDGRIADNVLTVGHETDTVGVLDLGKSLGDMFDLTWVDKRFLNAKPLSTVLDFLGHTGQYRMRINMSQNIQRNVKMYGVAPHQRGKAADALRLWNTIDPLNPDFALISEGGKLSGNKEVLDSAIAKFSGAMELFGKGEPYYRYGLVDMQLDMLAKAQTEESLWNDLITTMRGLAKNKATATKAGVEPWRAYKFEMAADLFDGIKKIGKGTGSKKFNDLSWREQMTFLGWLNQPDMGHQSGLRKAASDAGTIKDMFEDSVWARLKKWMDIDESLIVANMDNGDFLYKYREALNDIATISNVDMDKFVNQFLSDMSAVGSSGTYFENRIRAEGAAAISYVHGMHPIGQAEQVAVDGIMVPSFENMYPGLKSGYASKAESSIHEYRNHGILQDITSSAKATSKDFNIASSLGKSKVDNMAATSTDPAWFVVGKDRQTAQQLSHVYRLNQRLRESYKRALSAEGYDMAMWGNRTDSWHGALDGIHDVTSFRHGEKPFFPNYLITNPKSLTYDAISFSNKMPRTKDKPPRWVAGSLPLAPKTKLPFIEHGGSDTVLDPDNFIREYETLFDQAFKSKPINPRDEDPLQLAVREQSVLIKKRAQVEDSIARAGTRLDELNAKLWDLEYEETLAKKKAQTAQAASLAAHLKAQQFIKAEDSLNRLGAGVDANGNEIPLDQLSDDLRNLRFAVNILGEADAEAMRMTASAIDQGVIGADALSTLSPVGDDKFFFPLTRTQNFEEVMESVWQSGFKPIGSHTQGPKEIVEAMTAVTRFKSQGGFGAFLKHYDKLHNLLKGYMILKPGFHMRNYFSGVFMNYLHGVDISSYRQFQRAYWKFQHDEALRMGLDKRAGDIKKAMGVRKIWGKVSEDHVDIIRQMSEGNILGGSQGQVAGEFGVSPMVGGRRINFSAINPLDSRNAPLRLSRNIGVGTETFIRGVMGFDVLKKGGMVDEAFDTVVKFHFDYDDLSDFERSFVKRLVPFYTWTKKNLPLMLEQIGRNPAKMTAYLKAKKEIERGQEKPAVIPDYFIRQGGIQLPFKYKGENMFVLPDLPFKSPIEMIDPALQFRTDLSVAERARIAIGTLGTMTTPIIKAPYEWNAKQNLWKGYTFDGRYQQVPTVFYKTPLLMPMMQAVGLATKENDIWMMRDHDLHAMAQMLPTFSDMRRLFPSEERYQQRTLSTWMSFVFGLGLRTNTKEEQERTVRPNSMRCRMR
jgi:hypothetical protein